MTKKYINQDRPLNINPFSIRLPVMACVSIMHRLSGVVVFLFIPVALWSLQHSLSSPEGFKAVQLVFSGFLPQFLAWILISALGFHLFAGIRHLLMDMKWGSGLPKARFSAWIVWVLAVIWACWVGYWLLF